MSRDEERHRIGSNGDGVLEMTKIWCLVCKEVFETKRRKVAYFCSSKCRKAASRRYAKTRRSAAEAFERYADECTSGGEIAQQTRNGEVAPTV